MIFSLRLVATVLALTAGGASASTLIDRGLETWDPLSGLAWLDLTETEGDSAIEAVTDHAAYRVATQDEVMSLFANADLPVFSVRSATLNAAAEALISLLGRTVDGVSSYAVQGQVLGHGGTYYNDPFVAMRDADTATPEAQIYTGLNASGWLAPTSGISGVGVFLVREIPDVPLPASGLVLLLGLGGLAGLRRRRG
ncbi:VPLPA-CTERM sorting domain-containing protein [Salipiger sp.]|uniref:VPLPA-CTERM sorting domain-containing protein n=1 Tax=Salipiger sp. TaxID=2078585 RepID=UPI003A96E4B2